MVLHTPCSSHAAAAGQRQSRATCMAMEGSTTVKAAAVEEKTEAAARVAVPGPAPKSMKDFGAKMGSASLTCMRARDTAAWQGTRRVAA